MMKYNLQIINGRTNKLNTGLLQLLRKSRILAKESISGMYRLHAILYANFNNRINVEICSHRGFVTGEFECLVCIVPMLGESICC